MSFVAEFARYSWEDIASQIYAKTPKDVLNALNSDGPRTIQDFFALISPAAAANLEQMAVESQHLTQKRFGKTIQLYAPMYLSNECQNICTYCGFSLHNKIARKTLVEREIREELIALKALGFQHILLVTGEAQKTVGLDYFLNALEIIVPQMAQVSLEVQPLEEADYRTLGEHGVHAVLVYQETYHRDRYREYHLKGRKANFEYRLDTPDRLGRAGIHKIGIGALIGLEDWRVEAAFVALHLEYLRRTYWQTKYSISFPRLRPAEGMIEPRVVMTDAEFVQLLTAYRLFDEFVELSLSTREEAGFRNNIFSLGVTTMSAGSRTEPGGYTAKGAALEQFEISDERSPSEVAEVLRTHGYEPVWKDWDSVFSLAV